MQFIMSQTIATDPSQRNASPRITTDMQRICNVQHVRDMQWVSQEVLSERVGEQNHWVAKQAIERFTKWEVRRLWSEACGALQAEKDPQNK